MSAELNYNAMGGKLTNMSRSSRAQKDEMNGNHVNNVFLTMKNGHLNSQRNYVLSFSSPQLPQT